MITTFMRENAWETSFSLLLLVPVIDNLSKQILRNRKFLKYFLMNEHVLWIEHTKNVFYFCLKIQNVRNNNVHINVSNEECSNIDLKLRKKKTNKMRERKKVSFIIFLVQSSRANPKIYPETSYLTAFLQKICLENVYLLG